MLKIEIIQSNYISNTKNEISYAIKVPTGNWASSNAAFTTSCRSCGSAIVRLFFASRFSAMLLSPKLSHQVRQLTYRISSESYPGNQECVVNYYGAERL